MSFINLTPHAITVVSPNGETVSIAPSGQVARCTMANTPAGVFDGIFLNRTTYGSVEGLPSPVEGVMLVVSGLVRAACPDRLDLASPGDLVRSPEGAVVGCRGLVVN
jgi:hypothetical protein